MQVVLKIKVIFFPHFFLTIFVFSLDSKLKPSNKQNELVLGDIECLEEDKSFIDDNCFESNKHSSSRYNLEFLESHHSEENGHDKTQNLIDSNVDANNKNNISLDQKSNGRKSKENEIQDEYEQNGLLQFSEENIE